MFEKVNPMHPDKIADRIAGCIVDFVYTLANRPTVAVEVMIGHNQCFVVVETSENITHSDIEYVVHNIIDDVEVVSIIEKQDTHLLNNQSKEIKIGDNGIFKGVPLSNDEAALSIMARIIYSKYPYDGKYILDKEKLIICQSNASNSELKKMFPSAIINPLGEWTGGINVDVGCTNRKLGSDMAKSVTGGGLHGKDLSKADVSVNIYAFLKAQETGEVVELSCAIGDDSIDGKPYKEIVDIAKEYIKSVGGFEKFAEWGLV